MWCYIAICLKIKVIYHQSANYLGLKEVGLVIKQTSMVLR